YVCVLCGKNVLKCRERGDTQRARSSPMLLVIDAGNSNLTLGVFNGAELLAQCRLLTDRDKSAEQYAREIRELVECEGIEGMAIASVVPQLDNALAEIAAKDFGVT